MLIQCHSCNTKYRLNMEQLPRRKTFVRCKNCGTPIYIDPTEEEAAAAAVIPPDGMEGGTAGDAAPVAPVAAESAALAADQVLVVCPSCDARYRIDADTVARPKVKFKCTQCGHLFPMAAAAGLGAAVPPVAAPAPGPQAPVHVVGAKDMPLPDEGQVEHMFDDLRPDLQGPPEPAPSPWSAAAAEAELGDLGTDGFGDEQPAPDAEQAYLDAVAFGDESDRPARAGAVPDDQKYRFFLNPKDRQQRDEAMANEPGAPDDLPPLDSPLAEEPAADLPPLPDDAPPPPSTSVAHSRDEMAQVREVVPGQEARLFTEKRVLSVVAAAAVLILVGTGVWGYWLANSSGTDRPYTVRIGQPHQLALENDLQGHYVTNVPSGRRLFVVNGAVENRFDQTPVRWIRIKGMAFAGPDDPNPLGETVAYAGNLLEDSQLTHWELPAIKAYYGFVNGRKSLNEGIPTGAKVPYQLVFADVPEDVGRTVAQIVSYHRDGQAVFIDNP